MDGYTSKIWGPNVVSVRFLERRVIRGKTIGRNEKENEGSIPGLNRGPLAIPKKLRVQP
jgi:hypothetical protein